MSGLRWPIVGNTTISQHFDGEFYLEPKGYLRRDVEHNASYGSRTWLPNAENPNHIHLAVDVPCPVGTLIVAPEKSVLVAAGTYASTGEHYAMLQIRPGVVLFFTHLTKVQYAVGKQLNRGQGFALSGASGHVDGPHLHFELRKAANTTADPHNSGTWIKWNVERFRVGGDMAGVSWIKPL